MAEDLKAQPMIRSEANHEVVNLQGQLHQEVAIAPEPAEAKHNVHLQEEKDTNNLNVHQALIVEVPAAEKVQEFLHLHHLLHNLLQVPHHQGVVIQEVEAVMIMEVRAVEAPAAVDKRFKKQG